MFWDTDFWTSIWHVVFLLIIPSIMTHKYFLWSFPLYQYRNVSERNVLESKIPFGQLIIFKRFMYLWRSIAIGLNCSFWFLRNKSTLQSYSGNNEVSSDSKGSSTLSRVWWQKLLYAVWKPMTLRKGQKY